MKEVDLQSYVIKVVRANGGAARKLSHRFNLGVSDLLVQLPTFTSRSTINTPAMLLEVKLHRCALDSDRSYTLDVTKPQREFLREFKDAGMCVGVLSFVIGKIGMRRNQPAAAIFKLDWLHEQDYRVTGLDHQWFGDKSTKDALMYAMLEGFARG